VEGDVGQEFLLGTLEVFLASPGFQLEESARSGIVQILPSYLDPSCGGGVLVAALKLILKLDTVSDEGLRRAAELLVHTARKVSETACIVVYTHFVRFSPQEIARLQELICSGFDSGVLPRSAQSFCLFAWVIHNTRRFDEGTVYHLVDALEQGGAVGKLAASWIAEAYRAAERGDPGAVPKRECEQIFEDSRQVLEESREEFPEIELILRKLSDCEEDY
jgi:hypothetical protein